jgi:glucose 1-dehydrogenase
VSAPLNQQPSARRLDGKIALVTGAGRGIGRGIALCLAEEGAHIVVNDLPPRAGAVSDAENTALEIESLGCRALVHYADVSDRTQVEALVSAAVAHFGRLDVTVANAAYSDRQRIVDASWEGVRRTLEVTQFGVFHTCQMAARQMVAQGHGGKIVIIGSLLAELPYETSAAYNMAKAAVNHFGRTLANELAHDRINVNIINPGYIDTPGERKFASEADLERSAHSIPWGRLGTARDIGRLAVYLCSDDADYISGSAIVIDGAYKVALRLPNVVMSEAVEKSDM